MQVQFEYDSESEPDTDERVNFRPPNYTKGMGIDNTPIRSHRKKLPTPSRPRGASEARHTSSSGPFCRLPPRIALQVISLSETLHASIQRRPRNTGDRKKILSRHAIIAEATKATGAMMAQHMQDIADASKKLERSKIEVQLKLLREYM